MEKTREAYIEEIINLNESIIENKDKLKILEQSILFEIPVNQVPGQGTAVFLNEATDKQLKHIHDLMKKHIEN